MKSAGRALLGLCLLLAAPALADTGQRLAELRKQIEAREARARALADEAEGALGELEAVDIRLAEVRRSIRALRARERAAQSELAEARAGQTAAEAELARVEADLERRLVALYKFSAVAGGLTLASSGDVAASARRRQGLARVVDQDRELFAEHRAARARLAEAEAAAQASLAEIAGARREASRREARVREQVVERRNLVALLRSRSEGEQRAAAELRRAAERLEETLARMPARSFVGGGLERERLPPVAGEVRLPFGRQTDPEFGTQTLRNGIEIAAPAGAPVVAVADGRVLFSGWFRGYGQMLIVDHGSGDLTVLGYLSELLVDKGETVHKGQEIGTVGDTGSLSGPGLYFEVRRSGKPVDPERWLSP